MGDAWIRATVRIGAGAIMGLSACVLAGACQTNDADRTDVDAGSSSGQATDAGRDAEDNDDDASGSSDSGDAGAGAGDADADADADADGDGDAGPSGIEVTATGAKAVTNGGRYEQATLDGIPPFSSGVAELTIANVSGAPLVVHAVTLAPAGATEAFEWALNQPSTTTRKALLVSEQSIPADGGFTFGLFFEPLASGPRDVVVDISYGSGQHYIFTVAGRGRDNASFSAAVKAPFERVFGRSNVAGSNSFEPGGIVADANANLFFNGNVRQWNDKFNTNIVMARVAANGTLAWVRELQEPFAQESRDIGNNGEIGGGEDSIDVDGAHAYMAAERALVSSGPGGCLVMSVDSTTGALTWARHLNLNATMEDAPIAAQVLRCQTVDAALGDRVLVSGQIADSQGGFLAALSKTDGALLWMRQFGAGATRVGALVVDTANKRAYAGGTMGNAPFIARFDAVDTTTPTSSWIRTMGPSASNVHGLALDDTGLLVAFDIRGATTYFTGARVAVADGSVVWSKTWDAAGSATNRALSVAVHGGRAIFSGRIGFQPFDTTRGDGFLLALAPATGAYEWGSFYYGGKGNETIMSTLGTGLVSTANGLWILSYQTPGAGNANHFWGRWYQANDDTLVFPAGTGSMRLADAGFTAGAPGSTTLDTPANATAHLATVTATEWADVTSTLTFQDPVEAEAASFQAGTQALLQRLTITP